MESVEAEEKVEQRRFQEQKNAAAVLQSVDRNLKGLQDALTTAKEDDAIEIRTEIRRQQDLRTRAYDVLLSESSESSVSRTPGMSPVQLELSKFYDPVMAQGLARRLAESGQEDKLAELVKGGMSIPEAIKVIFPEFGSAGAF